MAFTRIQIISQALTLLGKGPVNDLVSAGEFGAAADQTYDLLYPYLLGTDNWRFNVAIKQLSVLVDSPPVDRWRFALQLPSDYLSLVRTYPLINDFNIYEDKIFTNTDDISLEYHFEPDEFLLPAYFVAYFVYSLAEHLALAVALQESYAKEMAAHREIAYAKALFTDAQSHPTQSIVSGPFITTRFGGNRFGTRVR